MSSGETPVGVADSKSNPNEAPASSPVVLNEFLAETCENLFRFKNESLFTDVQIYVEGVEFPCHKVILCAASAYFRAMFTCDLKEARHGKVYIENISPWNMKRLLDFIYTGRIEISPENVIDLFNAALLFQLHALVDKCTSYIQSIIDLTNCVEINLFASMHNLEALEASSFKFMLENFMQLVNLSVNPGQQAASTPTSLMSALLTTTTEPTPEASPDSLYSSFVRLNEQTFTALLKSDLLNVTREVYAYYALIKWLDHDQGRAQLYDQLLGQLRLNTLNRDELEFIVKHDKYLRGNSALRGNLTRLIEKHHLPPAFMASLVEDHENVSSDVSTSLARPSTILRDYFCNLVGDRFEVYDFYKNKWSPLSSWPPESPSEQANLRGGYSTCCVNNVLYVMGGYVKSSSESSPPLEIVDWVYKYDAISNEWAICQSMLRPRAFHVALSVSCASGDKATHKNNFIILFYGITPTDIDLLERRERRSSSGSSSELASTQRSTTWSPRYTQCLAIDLYNLQADQWTEIRLNDNSLLNHHIFHSYYQYSRSHLSTTGNSASHLPALIRLQHLQSKSICALKNLIYILHEACIHCYEFKNDTFICLPYFCLQFNPSQFILGGAVSVNLSEPAMSSSVLNTAASEIPLDEPVASVSSSSSESPTTDVEVPIEDAIEKRLRLRKDKEALIYLMNPTKSLLYEFYPTKNKLKKLPNLTLRHSQTETTIICINSKLYVTGGFIDESNPDGSAIEVFDTATNTWSIFMSELSSSSEMDDELDNLPVVRKFFKLKISMV